MSSALAQETLYTIDNIYALGDGERAELIDGQIYYMAPPSRKHQYITGELFGTIWAYIKSNNGSCKPYVAPFAVFLNKDDKNYVEPDISIILVAVYDFQNDNATNYTFEDDIPVNIYPGFSINLSSLNV